MSTITVNPSPPALLVLPARQPMLSPVSWRVLIFLVVVVLALQRNDLRFDKGIDAAKQFRDLVRDREVHDASPMAMEKL